MSERGGRKSIGWWLGHVMPPIVALAALVAAWRLAIAYWETPRYLVPSPEQVWFVALEQRAKLCSAAWMTGSAALAGFLLSCLVGLAVGLLFSQSRWIRNGGYPYAIFLQTVPIVAIAPLIITWFGAGFRGVVIVSFIISLFPVITNTASGLLSTPVELRELFRLYGATRLQTMLWLQTPHAVAHIVVGARTASGLSVVGAIVGEFFAGYGARDFGLGYLIRQSAEQLKTDLLFASIGASALLGLAIFALASGVGYGLLGRWSRVDT